MSAITNSNETNGTKSNQRNEEKRKRQLQQQRQCQHRKTSRKQKEQQITTKMAKNVNTTIGRQKKKPNRGRQKCGTN